jgi:signal transduction histidine kinase
LTEHSIPEEMSKKNILTREGAKQLGRSMEQLISSLDGLLSITENMIPEKIFFKDFREYYMEMCDDLGTEYSIQINVGFTGDFNTIDDDQKVNIYLVVRSLLNFLVNHTKPTQIDLSFIRSEKSISIHVSDNGRKYNLAAQIFPGIEESENIKTLTKSMNGFFTILDNRKEGNTLRITFND